MANPLVFEIFYFVKDAENETSKTSVFVDAVTPFDDVLSVIPLLGNLIQDVLTGAIVSAGVTVEIDTVAAGFTAIPDLISDIQEGLQMGIRSVNGFLKTWRLPTIDEGVFLAGSKDMDTADAGIAALVAAMETGIDVDPGGGTTLVTFCDVRGEDLVNVEYGREKFRGD